MPSYHLPIRRRVRAAGLLPDKLGISVLGIEVTQTVQDLQNSVPLVGDKATVARVYLDARSLRNARWISGELAWRRGNGTENYLPTLDRVRLRPSNPLGVNEQRHDLEASLNFRLPADAIGTGSLSIRVHRLFIPGGDDVPIEGSSSVTVNFQTVPSLTVRVVGFRYRVGTSSTFVSPSAIHFSFLRSYLERAYPVAEVNWSQIVVDANFTAPFSAKTPIRANAQLAAIRSREVSSGFDPRTHYYGLVDDNRGSNFMRGLAFAIPAQPRPDTVASGPAGVPNGWNGDRDASYADWYGAHELGHTFGRFHPGFPPGGQDASDPTFPYPNGQISTNDDRFVGIDVGDPSLGLPMQALPGQTHHDIMTYEENQWLSAYTYEAIMNRLLEEDALTF